MGLLDKFDFAIKKVSDLTNKLENVSGFTKDFRNEDVIENSLLSKSLHSKTKEKNDKQEESCGYKQPKFESLRPLARTVLMKDEVSERDLEIMKRKAVSLGMDADEFEMLFEGLVSKKQSAIRTNLFGKKIDDGDFDFDEEFDELFISAEEKQLRDKKELNDGLDFFSSFFK